MNDKIVAADMKPCECLAITYYRTRASTWERGDLIYVSVNLRQDLKDLRRCVRPLLTVAMSSDSFRSSSGCLDRSQRESLSLRPLELLDLNCTWTRNWMRSK